MHDAYLSVVEALTHGGIENDVSVELQWVDSEGVTDANAAQILGHADGIIVPGGFGDRGIEGMIASARYAREKANFYTKYHEYIDHYDPYYNPHFNNLFENFGLK